MQRKSNKNRAFWVLIAILVIALAIFLYGGLGGPEEETFVEEDESGIEMREDVDAVIFTEDEGDSAD